LTRDAGLFRSRLILFSQSKHLKPDIPRRCRPTQRRARPPIGKDRESMRWPRIGLLSIAAGYRLDSHSILQKSGRRFMFAAAPGQRRSSWPGRADRDCNDPATAEGTVDTSPRATGGMDAPRRRPPPFHEATTAQPVANDRRLAALMQAAQDGDCVAYAGLLRELVPLLQRLVRRRLGFLQPTDRVSAGEYAPTGSRAIYFGLL